MVNEFEFMGITCKKDAAICLSSTDKPFKIFGYDQSIILSKLFFPEAYKDGLKLYSYVENCGKHLSCKTNKIIYRQIRSL